MTVTLTATRALQDGDKLSPQAKVIMETIIGKVGPGKPIDRQALVDELKAQGKLQTRQDVGRIVSFYQPRLEEAGLLQKTKAEAAPKATKNTGTSGAKVEAGKVEAGKVTTSKSTQPAG